jgi:hypothetical protein
MNPSYLRLRRPLQDAMARYAAWIGTPELAPPQEVSQDDAIDLALDQEQWKGLAVYIFGSGQWTVFAELSGGLGGRPAADWVRLADGGDLVYAGYNDAIGYGELVRVDRGQLVRQFLGDEQDPSADVNVGRLPTEAERPLAHWADVSPCWSMRKRKISRAGSAAGSGSTELPDPRLIRKSFGLPRFHALSGPQWGSARRIVCIARAPPAESRRGAAARVRPDRCRADLHRPRNPEG